MRVGSLVICPNGAKVRYTPVVGVIKDLPASNEIVYTVRSISFCRVTREWCIRIQEATLPINDEGNELAWMAKLFREVQPPLDLSELLEETILETA